MQTQECDKLPAKRPLRRMLMLLGGSVLAILVSLGLASPAQAVTHNDAMFWFYVGGISVSSTGNCSHRDVPSCTSFEGLRDATLHGMLTLKSASGCSINITGGTEAGHAGGTYSHWNGWKLDISHYSCIDNYVRTRFTYVGYIAGWGHQWRSGSGNLYTDEGGHWDILVYNCGGC